MLLGVGLGVGIPVATIVGGTIGGIAIYQGKKAYDRYRRILFGKSLYYLESVHFGTGGGGDALPAPSSSSSSSSDSFDHSSIPLILSKCVSRIVPDGLEEDHLFGRLGNIDNVQRLRKIFNTKNEQDIDISKEPFEDICSLIKIWLYELPEAIIPTEIAEALFELSRSDDENGINLIQFKEILLRLRDRNYESLRFLMKALYTTWNYSAVNGMNLDDLSSAFGPFIFHQKRTAPTYEEEIKCERELKKKQKSDERKMSRVEKLSNREKIRMSEVNAINVVLRMPDQRYPKFIAIKIVLKTMIEFFPEVFVENYMTKEKRSSEYVRI